MISSREAMTYVPFRYLSFSSTFFNLLNIFLHLKQLYIKRIAITRMQSSNLF